MNKTKLAVGLRFFGANPDNIEKDLGRLRVFLEEAEQYGKIYVAVNVADDKTNALAYLAANYPTVDAFGVTPWQKFVPAMNSLVYRATLDGAEVFISASAEFPPRRAYILPLLEHLDDDTLVVGARFSEHEFKEGEHPITGASSPWKTFAVWNLRHLAKFGFPLVGDGPFDQSKAGVEEVAAIALHQERAGKSGYTAKAKLATLPDFYGEWNTAGWDEARHAAHAKKIVSKSARPAQQLAWADLPTPTVIHIT